MIETHINPEKALSDKAQQIKPHELNSILEKLVVRQKSTDNEKFTSSLQGLRTQIDDLDSELLEVLKRRMNVAELIGQNKKENGVTILQTDRWSKILENRIKIGGKYNLSEEFILYYDDLDFPELEEAAKNIFNKLTKRYENLYFYTFWISGWVGQNEKMHKNGFITNINVEQYLSEAKIKLPFFKKLSS